jgi:hypothetical protein
MASVILFMQAALVLQALVTLVVAAVVPALQVLEEVPLELQAEQAPLKMEVMVVMERQHQLSEILGMIMEAVAAVEKRLLVKTGLAEPVIKGLYVLHTQTLLIKVHFLQYFNL